MAETSPTKQYDLYAPVLNFKKEITERLRIGTTQDWVPAAAVRRLQAYEILTAFYFNYSRDYRFLPASGDDSQNDTIKEMGDAAWLCDKIKAKLLGDTLTVTIPLPKEVANLKSLNEQLATSTEGEGETVDRTKIEKQIVEAEIMRDMLRDREAFLQDWWDKYNVYLQVQKNETKCSYTGDCVYMTAWDEKLKTATVKTYDPGFVFPEWDIDGTSMQEGSLNQVQHRVMVAWEEEGDSDTFLIWRDIYELRQVGAELQCWRLYGWYEYAGGDETQLSDLGENELVENSSAGWENLGIDFMPFVWIPNIELEGEDFGMSNLQPHMATLDSIINLDTDLDKNATKLGGAIVALSGKNLSLRKDATTREPVAINVQPSTTFNLGENGKMELLDVSNMQDALLATVKDRLDKLIRNTSITEVGAGLVSTTEELAGIALKMLLQPLIDMIGPMRSQRQRHYTTLFDYIQRLFQTFGEPDAKALFADVLYDVILSFGKIVPEDQKSKVEYYLSLMQLLDEETVLEMMKDDGFEFDIQTVMARRAAGKAAAAAQLAASFRLGDAGDAGGAE